jgi:hypothetical protein
MDEGAADLLTDIQHAVIDGRLDKVVFAKLGEAMARLVGFKVYTVLEIDPATLRSIRLHSSEPSYPIGGTKQHMRSAWSQAVFDRRTYFLAPDLTALRATFPDSAAIEAVGCGSVLAVPIIANDGVAGTMNLWHREGYYDSAKGELALPFAAAIAPIVRDEAQGL